MATRNVVVHSPNRIKNLIVEHSSNVSISDKDECGVPFELPAMNSRFLNLSNEQQKRDYKKKSNCGTATAALTTAANTNQTSHSCEAFFEDLNLMAPIPGTTCLLNDLKSCDINEMPNDECSKFGTCGGSSAEKTVTCDTSKFNSKGANIFDVMRSRGTKICNVENSLRKNIHVLENKLWEEGCSDEEGSSTVSGWHRSSRVAEQDSWQQQSRTSHSPFPHLENASENSDQDSDSSPLEGVRIEDIHNSVNRFVNNDIKCEQGMERKLANVTRAKDLKNKVASDDSSCENSCCWNVDATVPELNTLKERILINSLDKVFNQQSSINPHESDIKHHHSLDGNDGGLVTRESKQTNLSSHHQYQQQQKSSSSCFQMIENRLFGKWDDRYSNTNCTKMENSHDENAPHKNDIAFWDSWALSGEAWEESSKDINIAANFKTEFVESKPQRMAKESPTKQKNSETATAAIRFINDIKSSNSNERKLTNNEVVGCTNLSYKVNNIQSSNKLQQQHKWEIQADQNSSLAKTVASCKDVATASRSSPFTPFKLTEEWQNEDMDVGSGNRETRQEGLPLANKVNSHFLNGQHHSKSEQAYAATSAKNDSHSRNWTQEMMNSEAGKSLLEISDLTSSYKINMERDIASATSVAEFDLKWMNKNKHNDSQYTVDTAAKMSSCSARKYKTTSTSSSSPSYDEATTTSDVESGNFFIPSEILSSHRDKATNTGATEIDEDVVYSGRQLTARCREINQHTVALTVNDDSSTEQGDVALIATIGLNYKCDKSTMTDGNQYTVKVKPLREDVSNIFPAHMADAILDLYEKCNGNMDWIIEILIEDGYSPSDHQLEYLSSLQNVVEYDSSLLKGDADVAAVIVKHSLPGAYTYVFFYSSYLSVTRVRKM